MNPSLVIRENNFIENYKISLREPPGPALKKIVINSFAFLQITSQTRSKILVFISKLVVMFSVQSMLSMRSSSKSEK